MAELRGLSAAWICCEELTGRCGGGSAAEIAGEVLPLLRDLIPHAHAAILRQEPRGQTLTRLAKDGAGEPLAKLQDRVEIGDLGVAFAPAPRVFVRSFCCPDQTRSRTSCPSSFMPRESTLSCLSPWVITSGCLEFCCLAARDRRHSADRKPRSHRKSAGSSPWPSQPGTARKCHSRPRPARVAVHKPILVREGESRRIARSCTMRSARSGGSQPKPGRGQEGRGQRDRTRSR